MLLLLACVCCAAALVGLLAAGALQRHAVPLPSLLQPRPAAVAVRQRPGCKLLVHQSVDGALERLLERVLTVYLQPWCDQVSQHPAFLYELRQLIGTACVELVRRYRCSDLSALILRRLVPAALRHVDCCLSARRFLRSGSLSDEAGLDYYGRDAHVAISGEARYVRLLCDQLVPLLVPPGQLLSSSTARFLTREVLGQRLLLPLLDLLADPDTVNHLLQLLFAPEPMEQLPEDRSRRVELLREWRRVGRPTAASPLAVSLSTVLRSSDLLYSLTQSLKERRALHLVQFCLAVEEFNHRMLNPDLNDDQLRRLYSEASHIYNCYLRPEVADNVDVDADIVNQVQEVLCGPVDQIVRLRQMRALYEAYEQVFNRIEVDHMPSFLCSRHFMEQVCRRPDGGPVCVDGAGGKWRSARGLTAVTRWSRRLRDVLRTPTVDGRMEEVDELGEEMMVTDERPEEDSLPGNLALWTINIPLISMTIKPSGKQVIMFILDVRCPDPKSTDGQRNWKTARQLNEFYILERRLTEFHGGLSDVRLPPKQSMLSTSFYTQDFLDCRKPVFLSFLRRLVLLPGLSHSQLVRSFLTSDEMLADDVSPDLNIGKIIRTVPKKFRKERGQCLDAFMLSLMASVEPGGYASSGMRSRSSRADLAMESDDLLAVGPLAAAAVAKTRQHRRQPSTVVRPRGELRPAGLYDALTLLAVRLLEPAAWLLAAVRGLRPLLRHSADALADRLLHGALQQALVPPRCCRLVQLTEELVFAGRVAPRTDAHKTRLADATLAALRAAIPAPVKLLLGPSLQDGCRALFSCLQLPQLNKQLVYVLLDEVVLELFPELEEKDPLLANAAAR